MKTHNKRGIKSATNVSDIIKIVREADGAQLSEITDKLNLSNSTVHHYLTTLEEEELLTREGNKYYLSLRYLEYGIYAQNRKREYILAHKAVQRLAKETKERAQFIVEEHGKGVYVHMETGDHAVQTDAGLGKWGYLHATAAGKAILAYLPEERVDEIIERQGLPAVTENTITTREELSVELDRIRETGVGINNQEDTDGLRAVGVPVRNGDGDLIGSLSVSAPTHRLKDELLDNQVSDLLFELANELELKIAYEA